MSQSRDPNLSDFGITADTNSEERQKKYAALKTALQLNPKMGKAKRDVLLVLSGYAEKNLVNKYFTTTSSDRIATYNRILANAQLPDLLFLHHVGLELQAIRDDNSSLKDNLSVVVAHGNQGLRRKHINDTRLMFVAFLSVMSTIDWRFASSLALILTLLECSLPKEFRPSEIFVDMRVDSGYQDYLSKPYQEQKESLLIEDGLDDFVTRTAGVGRKAVRSLFVGLLQTEEKRIDARSSVQIEEIKEGSSVKPK